MPEVWSKGWTENGGEWADRRDTQGDREQNVVEDKEGERIWALVLVAESVMTSFIKVSREKFKSSSLLDLVSLTCSWNCPTGSENTGPDRSKLMAKRSQSSVGEPTAAQRHQKRHPSRELRDDHQEAQASDIKWKSESPQ